MCKNNLYRDTYGAVDDFLAGKEELIGIDVTWFNANRIPNPGTWSTNRRSAWGGVALDLFPHLYTQLVKVFGGVPDCQRGSHSMAQQWKLQDCIDNGTDYGNMDPNGIYNVCDYAQETWYIDDKYPINIKASWKQGYDDQSIKIYTEDSIYQWNFGLCPAKAYGSMIETGIAEPYDVHRQLDFWIHKNLEKYHEG
jgi:predicted dehydrogenase